MSETGSDAARLHMADTMADHITDPPDDDRPDRATFIGAGLRWVSEWALRFIFVVIALVILQKALGAVWVGLLPILLAIIVSTVLWPPVRLMIRYLRFPPALAALTALLAAAAVFVGVIALMLPSIVDQSQDLAAKTNEAIRSLQQWIKGPPLNVQDAQIEKALEVLTHRIQESSNDIATSVFSGVTAVGSALVTLVMVLMLSFFFLKDGPRFIPWLSRNVGRNAGRHVVEVLTRIWITLGGFIRTQALVSFVDAVFIGIGLLVLDVPLAWALIVLTFIGGFIPMIGAFVAGALAVLVALVGVGPTTALIVLAIVIVVQQIEGNVLQPVLQSRAMELHPVVILLGVAAAGALFGIIGAFLAVPTLASIAVAFRYMNEQIDLRTGDVAAHQIRSATSEGRMTAWLGELAATKFIREHITPEPETFTADAGVTDASADAAGFGADADAADAPPSTAGPASRAGRAAESGTDERPKPGASLLRRLLRRH